MIYILLVIAIVICKSNIYILLFFKYIRMNDLRHQKYKVKRLKNNFKSINISINDLNKFGKKIANKEENIYKKYLVSLVRLVN